ncbi:MAG: hypothetical protein HYW90_00055, partial [Candidatus Sungbacteria bacterium]|nr:hypothetical protein [Candidatus Sungbacteria bacterium]
GACGTTGNQESGIMNQGTSTTETQDTIVESGTSNPELGTFLPVEASAEAGNLSAEGGSASGGELGTEATTTESAFAGATADKPVVTSEETTETASTDSATADTASSTPAETDTTTSATEPEATTTALAI